MQRDAATYKHTGTGIPSVIVELLEPIYDDLSNPELLEKCLDGRTQNNNECLNKLIWDRCIKEVWVGRNTLEQAVCMAVGCFNDGNVALLNLLRHLGISPGHFTVLACQKHDKVRIDKARHKFSEMSKSVDRHSAH